MLMSNGIDAFVGAIASGWVVDHFTVDGVKNRRSIRLRFAAYGMVLAVVFPFTFEQESALRAAARAGAQVCTHV